MIRARRQKHARAKRRACSRTTRRDQLDKLRSGGDKIAELLNGMVHKREWTPHHVASYDTILAGLAWRPDKLLPRHGWVVDFRPEIHAGEQIIVPDFAGWRAHRRVQPVWDDPYCSRSNTRYADAPDWIADIVEPSNVRLIRKIKLSIYHRLGVTGVWLIDRINCALEVHASSAFGWQLEAAFEGNGQLRAAPLRQFEFDLDGLWEPI